MNKLLLSPTKIGKVAKTAIFAATASLAVMAATSAMAWQSHTVSDSLDGKIGIGARVNGTVEYRGRTAPAYLGVQCVQNSTTVVLSHEGFAFFSRPEMRYRIDEQPSRNASAVSVSLNHRLVGWWHGNGIGFMKSLYGAKKLKVDVLDNLDGERRVFAFDIENAQTALAEVAAACKWGK